MSKIVDFYVYSASGEILRTGYAPEDMLQLQAGLGETVAKGKANDATQYVSDVATGTLADKPPLGGVVNKTTVLADGLDLVTISGLPTALAAHYPTRVEVRGPVGFAADVDDGMTELTFNYPGDYSIRLSHPLFIPQEIIIHAT